MLAGAALFIESKGPGAHFAEPPEFKEVIWLEAALRTSAENGWRWTEENFWVFEWELT